MYLYLYLYCILYSVCYVCYVCYVRYVCYICYIYDMSVMDGMLCMCFVKYVCIVLHCIVMYKLWAPLSNLGDHVSCANRSQ